MDTFDHLGGADSFFGRMYVFEQMLKEQHDLAGEGHGNGMYCYHGMNTYGNIVSFAPAILAIQVFVEELGYTRENLEELLDWYEGRTMDCVMLDIYIKLYLKGNDEQIQRMLKEAAKRKKEEDG